MRNASRLLPLAALAGLAVVSQAHAFSIAIANSGFENDAVDPNGVVVTTPASWTSTPLIGGNPPDGSVVDYVIDGSWYSVAGFTGAHSGDQYYLGGATTVTPFTFNILSQDTPLSWSDLSAGDSLTVSVWAAYAGTTGGTPYTNFWLNYSDGAGISSPTFFDVSPTAGLAPGQWTQLVWNYEVTQTAIDNANTFGWGAVNVGIGFADPDGATQIGFDDFSLDSTAIPEPSAALLTGLLGVTSILRRRRRN